MLDNLARQVRVSADTVRRWVAALSDLHLGFLVRPWFKNVLRSLRKEPKWYLRDWAAVRDVGQRAETLVACHLLKAVEGWHDLGLGEFELRYLRDKEKREVDFVVVRDGAPWFLVEVKHEDAALSPALRYFQRQLGAPFAFQATVAADYVDADCFDRPVIRWWFRRARCSRSYSDWACRRGQAAGQAYNGERAASQPAARARHRGLGVVRYATGCGLPALGRERQESREIPAIRLMLRMERQREQATGRPCNAERTRVCANCPARASRVGLPERHDGGCLLRCRRSKPRLLARRF